LVAERRADAVVDALGLAQRPLGAARRGRDSFEFLLGREQEVLALARPFLGQQGIAAHHQPLARVLGMSDLGEVGLIKQRQLQRPIADQLVNLSAAQRGDPLQARHRAELLFDAGLG
jgi:hypothetical protein